MVIVALDDVGIGETLHVIVRGHMNLIIVELRQIVGLIDQARSCLLLAQDRLVAAPCEGADRFLLRRHEGVILRHVCHAPRRNELDVSFLRAADVRNGILCQLDASFAVRFDHVTSDIWVALLALNDETVVTTARDDVLPHLGLTELRAIGTGDLDAVLVRALDLVLNDV